MIGRFLRGLAAVVLVTAVPVRAVLAAPVDSSTLESALGLHGTFSDGVFRATWPRTELNVTVDGFPITPRMGLTAWVAFRPHGEGAMVMGDLPLLADEIQPVLDTLAVYGLEVSALHNHFVGDEPRVMFLHVGGMGDPLALARGLRAALDTIRRIRAAAAPMPPAIAVSDLDVPNLDTILGNSGVMDDGVYKVTIARPGTKLTEMGEPINSAMGFNSWAGFEGTNDRAAVAGDVALLAAELNPVVHELRKAGIAVVAIHNHMIREEPRTVFVHFWGVGKAGDLARGVRAALDHMSVPDGR